MLDDRFFAASFEMERSMGLALAIKRSSRALMPPSLSNPKAFVRRQLMPAWFFLCGFEVGGMVYAPVQVTHISNVVLVVLLMMAGLRWWAGTATADAVVAA